ncbi:MAG TPA: hypothetical protein VLV90_04305 [Burkholderiales bacterium]|nr:hypothetical protein [Burkholderiales bacterium]
MRGPMLALLMLLPLAAAAHPHSARECSEGGDFIRNAARSRDTGTTREFFVSRLEEDLLLIRAFPPALRWFVFDEDDEQFLRVEVEAVFDAPEEGERHRAEFVERCTRRSERQSAPTV